MATGSLDQALPPLEGEVATGHTTGNPEASEASG